MCYLGDTSGPKLHINWRICAGSSSTRRVFQDSYLLLASFNLLKVA